MSRLDNHVGLVRFRLTLATFVRTLPWAGTILATVAFAVIATEHLSTFVLPKPFALFWIGVGISVVGSLAYAIMRRPSAHQAAVAIDERLGLNEKFSTALYIRSSNDPFAAAAVHDAEKTAATAKLNDKFPIAFPQRWTVRLILAAIIAVAAMKAPNYPLFSGAKPDDIKKVSYHPMTHSAAEQLARQAIADAEALPHEVTESEPLKLAKAEVQKTLDEHVADPVRTQQKAQDLLNQIESIKQKIAETKKFVDDANVMNAMKDISEPSPDEMGPVADAHRALAEGKLDDAVQDLKKTVDNFDKMDKKEQEKAAEQMQKLAAQVAKKANDPKVQQQVKDQLAAAGVDKKTADEIANKMKDAANGDPQAQQQVQQMANQAIQQANQQSGMSPQQQKAVANAIKNAVQGGQNKTNAQATAQQMAKASQALAQAMKQAAQQNQGNQGGQQQAKAQQGQGKQGQGKQGQGSQAQGQGAQAQAQAGQQGAGQQGAGQGQQQQAGGQTAQQAMQQQMAQLGAMAKDAQAVAAAQQAAQAGQGQGQQGQGNGQGQGQNQGQQANGQWGQGNNQGQGNQGNPQQGGQGGAQGAANGAAGGRRPDPVVAPGIFKTEYSESHTIDDGKIIANSFIKAPTVVGTSKMTLSKAIDSESKDDAGEVESDRIPRSAQKAVKDYFDTLKQEQK